jgi:hypothetical protein
MGGVTDDLCGIVKGSIPVFWIPAVDTAFLRYRDWRLHGGVA